MERDYDSHNCALKHTWWLENQLNRRAFRIPFSQLGFIWALLYNMSSWPSVEFLTVIWDLNYFKCFKYCLLIIDAILLLMYKSMYFPRPDTLTMMWEYDVQGISSQWGWHLGVVLLAGVGRSLPNQGIPHFILGAGIFASMRPKKTYNFVLISSFGSSQQ